MSVMPWDLKVFGNQFKVRWVYRVKPDGNQWSRSVAQGLVKYLERSSQTVTSQL
jgi:hypothetical protein